MESSITTVNEMIGSGNVPYVLGVLFIVMLLIGYVGAPLVVWATAIIAFLIVVGAPSAVTLAVCAVLAVFLIKPIRQNTVSKFIMGLFRKFNLVPRISDTERTALDAGVVWVEGDLFSGSPDFNKLIKEPYPELTKEEKDFIDGPVEELLAMVDEWKIWDEKKIPDTILDFLKKHKFFGMIIPKKYGGLEFSALAHSEVIMKIASRSIPVTITTMVPNSLGPAELLTHYGTDDQKNHYLPRLATGEEIPCFALTEPTAGSDASGMRSKGFVFKGEDGKLYMKINWNKRWITLASISTLLGVAFRLYDPENLLGKGEDVGITCALIPRETDGVIVGRRHDPLTVPFYNCPTQGSDVVVSVDAIIGGPERAGDGWAMLMDCLSAGRGVSLPAQSVGGVKMATRLVSSHSAVRKQFGIPIGKFEGIEEPLARIGGYTYLLEAMRKVTLSSLDQGIKPPVVTAMAKYHSTELGRDVVMDSMDILGGAAISRGPRNLISNYYVAAPICITVEGANILTRTLMIFGQGALRAHPYAYAEISSLEKNDLKGFDRALWGHIGHVVKNTFRTFLLGLTRGHIASSPVSGPVSGYYKKLSWVSAKFALFADIAMGTLGGKLKFKEMLTGRFADILSWMYIGYSVLRRYEAEGRKKEDLPLVHFAMKHSFAEIQKAFDGIYANMKIPGLSWLMRGPLRVLASMNSFDSEPSDVLTHKVCNLLLNDCETRDRLTHGIYLPDDKEDVLGRYEHAFFTVKKAEKVEKKIRNAISDGKLPRKRPYLLTDEALQKAVITDEEHKLLKDVEGIRWDTIQVDDFSEQEYLGSDAGPVSAGPSGTTGSNAVQSGDVLGMS